MSGYYEFFRVQFLLGLSKNRLKKAVEKNYIKDTEYKTITGEEYSAETA